MWLNDFKYYKIYINIISPLKLNDQIYNISFWNGIVSGSRLFNETVLNILKLFWVIEIAISFRSRIITIENFLLHLFKLINTTSKFQCIFDFLVDRVSDFVQLSLPVSNETLVSKLNQISVFFTCNCVFISISEGSNIDNMRRLIRQSFLHEICPLNILSFIVTLLWLAHYSRGFICVLFIFIRIVFYFVYFVYCFFCLFILFVSCNRSYWLFFNLKNENIWKFIYSIIFRFY